MVWFGTLLLTRGVVFQWASTKKTGRRSEVGIVKHGSSAYTATPTCTTLFIEKQTLLSSL